MGGEGFCWGGGRKGGGGLLGVCGCCSISLVIAAGEGMNIAGFYEEIYTLATNVALRGKLRWGMCMSDSMA